MKNLKSVVFDLFLTVAAFSLAFLLISFTSQNYNLVLISVDSLRPDHLDTFGYNKKNTPNIDGLASQSVIFPKSYTIYPSTVGSYYSLLTGNSYLIDNELAVLNFIKDFDAKKNSEYTNMTSYFKKNGYETSAFVSNPKLNKKIFETSFNEFIFDDNSQSLTKSALAKVENLADKRFFLWLDFTLESQVVDKATVEERLLSCQDEFWTEAGIKERVDEYDLRLKEIDQKIGQLLEVMNKKGIDKNTVFVVYSDKGETFDPRYYGLSKTVYESDVKNVLIVKKPKQLAKVTVDKPVDNSQVSKLLTSMAMNNDKPLQELQKLVENKLIFFRLSYGKNLKLGVTDQKYKYIYNLATDSCLPEKDASEF